MIVVESIGFAATHTIAAILRDLPGYEVSHGSQDFVAKTRLGVGGQSPDAFVASMRGAAETGGTPVALHTSFAPQSMKPACDGGGVAYRLLVRDPARQIESCYAWISRKVLTGQPVLPDVLRAALPVLKAARLGPGLPDILFAFAARHVTGYNVAGLACGARVVKMEEILADEQAFRELFAVPDAVEIGHFSGEEVKLASHRAKQADAPMTEPDRARILAALELPLGAARLSYEDYRSALGY
ncbi:hypothetical protein [Litorisediminicola beolgyonensis]|uniref:Sulfotransferase family protein n=1 Tax=Litorisediminicola beolgyonensis TaxID=1173614 RepID=A0ABW3ZFV1_9RHOB